MHRCEQNINGKNNSLLASLDNSHKVLKKYEFELLEGEQSWHVCKTDTENCLTIYQFLAFFS